MPTASAGDGAAAIVPVRISLLGQPRVEAADGSQTYALGRKTLNVLAYLVLHRRRPALRDSVAFALFPDEEEDAARNGLRRNLSYLLSSLPPRPEATRFVRTEHETLAWNEASHSEVDVIVFERAIAEGRDDDAIAVYGGDLLPTLYDEWTNAARERLRDAFHGALTRTIGRDRSIRAFDRATERARRLLDEDPWREDVIRELMAIRYEAGDRAGALSTFERFATQLKTVMAAEPMPETLAIRDAMLRGARLATSEPADRTSVAAAGSTALTLAFAGRGTALQRAVDVWHTAADGRASVLFASGQAGIGKSRFAAELARAIEREGGIVVRGETSAGGEHRPYEAFIDALRSASRGQTRAKPALDELLDDHMQAALADDRAARLRLFDAVRSGIAGLARTRPAAVILEDMHWAGSATIDLLEFVATRLGRTQLLLIVTFRSEELAPAHAIRPVRRQLTGRGIAHEIVLEPLDAAAARAAARGLEVPFDEATLEAAVERAAGVPLLLAEALRDRVAGREVGTGGIEELFGMRLARLSQTAETVLAYAAIVGARFDLSVLAATTGWTDDALVDALAESIELGLVRASAPGLAFGFTHHLVQAVVLERLTPDERAAFLLREAFDCDYTEIGAALDKSTAHCRQLVHRAKARLTRAGAPLEPADLARQRGIVDRLRAAIDARDQPALLEVLAGARVISETAVPIPAAAQVETVALGVDAGHDTGAETALALMVDGDITALMVPWVDARGLVTLHIVTQAAALAAANRLMGRAAISRLLARIARRTRSTVTRAHSEIAT